MTRSQSLSTIGAVAAKKKKRASTKPSGVRVTVTTAAATWLDTVIADIVAAGGPAFTRDQVLSVLLDATSARTFDLKSVKRLDDLRTAFSAVDLSRVERMLRDRPRIDPGVLDALKDTIK